MKYTRSAACITKLVDNGKGQILTKENCKIQIPYRFSSRGLGEVGVDTRIYGCFPIIFEDGKYTLCNVTAVLEINPFKTSVVLIDEVEYHQFEFKAGDVPPIPARKQLNSGIRGIGAPGDKLQVHQLLNGRENVAFTIG